MHKLHLFHSKMWSLKTHKLINSGLLVHIILRLNCRIPCHFKANPQNWLDTRIRGYEDGKKREPGDEAMSNRSGYADTRIWTSRIKKQNTTLIVLSEILFYHYTYPLVTNSSSTVIKQRITLIVLSEIQFYHYTYRLVRNTIRNTSSKQTFVSNYSNL